MGIVPAAEMQSRYVASKQCFHLEFVGRCEMPIDHDEDSAIALAAAVEYPTALYELIWEFNAKFPAHTLGEKYDAVARTIDELLGRDLIQLYRISVSDESQRELVAEESIPAVLRNPVTWYLEYAGWQVTAFPTEAGVAAHGDGGRRTPPNTIPSDAS